VVLGEVDFSGTIGTARRGTAKEFRPGVLDEEGRGARLNIQFEFGSGVDYL